MEMALGKMQVDGGIFQIAMAQQDLNGSEIAPASRRCVAKQCRAFLARRRGDSRRKRKGNVIGAALVG